MGGAIDPGFHRNTDIHLHVDEGPAEGASAGVTMMSERRWRVTGRGRGLFAIEVDDGGGFRAATAAEVDAALRAMLPCIRPEVPPHVRPAPQGHRTIGRLVTQELLEPDPHFGRAGLGGTVLEPRPAG